MKQFKDGKVIEVSNDRTEQVKRHFEKARAAQQARKPISVRELEERIKVLEEAVAALTAKEEIIEAVEVVEPAEALAE